jgi:peptidoglycan/LPS O-acetylase OafA/YrhL
MPRYQTIGAWRGAACLAVLGFHSFGAVASQPVWAPLIPLRAACEQGWMGLQIFFVISGYCIFDRMAAAVEGGESAFSFGKDRARRILPTYWAVLLLTLALNLAAWPFNRTHLADNFPPTIAALAADLSLSHVLLGLPPYVMVTWTLACEMAFYAAAAALLAANRGSARLLPAFAGGAVICVLSWRARATGWQLPAALWPDFFSGACVALALRSISRRDWVGLIAGLGALAALTGCAAAGIGGYGGQERKVALGFAWLLLALFPADAWLARRGPIRLLAWVGGFSYSLYLIHAQILTRAINLTLLRFAPASPFFLLPWLAALAAAIFGGWWVGRMIENPCERWRKGRRRREAGAAPAA